MKSIIFETEKYYVVNMSFRDKYYSQKYIDEFLNCWDQIIKYVTYQEDLNMSLDFNEKNFEK